MGGVAFAWWWKQSPVKVTHYLCTLASQVGLKPVIAPRINGRVIQKGEEGEKRSNLAWSDSEAV